MALNLVVDQTCAMKILGFTLRYHPRNEGKYSGVFPMICNLKHTHTFKLFLKTLSSVNMHNFYLFFQNPPRTLEGFKNLITKKKKNCKKHQNNLKHK
jgi:hypothetical protein